MPFTATGFEGLLVYEPKILEDSRGYFFESYNAATCLVAGITTTFIQDNQARSSYGVVRGMHFQESPYPQTKFLRVLSGAVLDVVLDLRRDSKTFGKTFSIELSDANKKQLYIPKGFAHGYSVLSESAEVFYKVDELYNKDAERGIFCNDPALNIDWQVPQGKQLVSAKDAAQPTFEAYLQSFAGANK